MTVRSPSETGDDELRWQSMLVRVATADESALGEFYDATASIVHGVVCRLIRDSATAEEITVRTFHDVWRNAPSYDASRGKPSTWLRTLARSRALDALRSRARERDGLRRLADQRLCDAPAVDAGPEQSHLASERGGQVRGALAALSGAEREAIELAYYGGMSHSEIAQLLAEPLGTVKSRIRSGMVKLRAALAPGQVET